MIPAEEWRKTRLVASVWWCGDDYCDCTKPVIERITPNFDAGYPQIRQEEIWGGKFLTNTGDYTLEERQRLQFAPLRAECERLGLPVPWQASEPGGT